jgi:predicted transcriptional regulator
LASLSSVHLFFEGKIVNPRTFENAGFDVVVDGSFALADFGVGRQDLVNRLSLIQKRCNDMGDGVPFFSGEVDAFPEVN